MNFDVVHLRSEISFGLCSGCGLSIQSRPASYTTLQKPWELSNPDSFLFEGNKAKVMIGK
jgi:hypothetical protein